jgi:hypothetical protein
LFYSYLFGAGAGTLVEPGDVLAGAGVFVVVVVFGILILLQ